MSMLKFLQSVPGSEGRDAGFLEGVASFLGRDGFDSAESVTEADAANLKLGPDGAFNAGGLAFVRRVIGHVNPTKAVAQLAVISRERLPRAPGRGSAFSWRGRERIRFSRARRVRTRGAHQEARRGAACSLRRLRKGAIFPQARRTSPRAWRWDLSCPA